MSGGGYSWLTPRGIIAVGSAYNPNYGKMAADSIAKEAEERKLIPAATKPEDLASGQEQVAPAIGTGKVTPRAD